jgi:UDP-N-acetylglucosamine 1-carboxyvinyltransferase
MHKISVIGGVPLNGRIRISGSKNSTLAIIAASILCDEDVKLMGIPEVRDVSFMLNLIMNLGGKVGVDGSDIEKHGTDMNSIVISNSKMSKHQADYDFVKKMRASILVLAPLLTRFGEAFVSMPGGCALGVRAVNLHIEILRAMGANITIDHGYIHAKSNGKLNGVNFTFQRSSVGATETAVCAAALANGDTILNNAAPEPEVYYLCEFLNSMGAKISGHGTTTIKISGIEKLHSTIFEVPEDRIEAASYAIAAAVTNGNILLENCKMKTFEAVATEFEAIGIGLKEVKNGVMCFKSKEKFQHYNVSTDIYPLFPTDVQPQIMIPLCLTDGTSKISENLFENRFMCVPELLRMGADISLLSYDTAIINSISSFSGANVMATDLRAAFALIIAALTAKGETIIDRAYHMDRGYSHVISKLSMCGANIKRVI